MDANAIDINPDEHDCDHLTPAPGQSLPYAAPPAWTHRRSTRRYLFVIAALLTLASSWWWGALLVYRVRVAYWQRACLDSTCPPGTVAYDDGPPDAATHPSVARTDRAWRQLADLFYPSGIALRPTVFVHPLQAPGRPWRLVVVELAAVRPLGTCRALDFTTRVFQPGRWGGLREVGAGANVLLGIATVGQDHRLRIDVGQCDPGNSAHFTITYQDGSAATHHLDGWLLEDDSVVLEPADSAALDSSAPGELAP